jgi:hypothetical protein
VEGGDWLKDRFDWKQALGPATDRPGHWNGNWGYWSTDGPRFTLSAHRLSAADTLGCGPEDVKQDKAAPKLWLCNVAHWDFRCMCTRGKGSCRLDSWHLGGQLCC